MMKTGPAANHHKGKILPTHNVMKPGAHPRHIEHKKNDDHKPEEKKPEHQEKKPEYHETGTIEDMQKPKKI
jgi:hypothetical protein